jgi:hypothetical protein
MVLDEGSVKELVATPLSSPGRVLVTEANRQGIVDPLTAMLFFRPQPQRRPSALRSQARFKRMDKVTADKGYAGPVVVCSLRYEPIVGHSPSKRGCWSKEARQPGRETRGRGTSCCAVAMIEFAKQMTWAFRCSCPCNDVGRLQTLPISASSMDVQNH